MRTDMFSENNGARPEDDGRPRIGIVVTDGKSRDSGKTAAAARRAIDAGIVLFAVGVGAGVDIPELNSIGSTPVCTHVFPLTDFEEMAPFVKEIETKSCQEPAPVKTGTVVTGVLLANQKQFFSLQANRSSGFTVKVSMSVGTTSLYASTKVKNPSPASFEHKVTASTTQTAQLYLSPSQLSVGLSASGTAQSRVVRQASPDNEQVQVYLTLEAGSGSQNEFKMESGHGDVRSSATNVSSMAGCLVFSLLAFLLSSFLKDL
ncbi:collagen alpha-1(XII) chain-like [Lingula anatina]|uniref:Collagen alpha-1(XII) chain-like n=1 Tax=Lingula anatina TaxID=7574 RepID=A0A1S3K9E0_LINAN|nr:collagen alpha-1(XII) chain-like [Lingula anatina]|eukprot:XP_013419064.1 collagen alpha-1(XII) chain-like [Lingula anatina]